MLGNEWITSCEVRSRRTGAPTGTCSSLISRVPLGPCVPYQQTETWFQATKTGTYHLLCTEYCGTDHSRMLRGEKQAHRRADRDMQLIDLARAARPLRLPHPLLADDVDLQPSA
jgi:hypothetical protein